MLLRGINKVIRILIYSDFILNSAWGFIGPVFAIFIVKNITVGDPVSGARVAGFASLCYWITKSLLQIPLSKGFDRKVGERDDYWFMFLGLLITGLSPFGFLISSLPWHIYLFQFLHATGMAMFIPSWNAVFTRHMDTKKAAYEWGMDSTLLGLGIGITGACGGLLVAVLGFKLLFILTGFLTISSAFLLLLIHKEILPRDHLLPRLPFIRGRQF